MNRMASCRTGILGHRFAILGLIAPLVCMAPAAAFAETEEEDVEVLDWILDHYDPNPYIADSPTEGGYHQPHEWAWKSDHQLKADVRDQLAWSPFVDEQDIEVSVEEGAVTLNGTVDDEQELQEAISNAYEAGPKKVISRLYTRGADEDRGGTHHPGRN